MPREHEEGPRCPSAVEGDWTLVQPEDAGLSAAKQEAAAPITAAPSKIHAARQDPSVPDVLTAKLVYCLLCLLDFAIKAGAALAQAARHAGEVSAKLAFKVAEHPRAASARAFAAQYTALLRQGDLRGAAGLAGRHVGEAAASVKAAASWAARAVDAAIFNSGAGAESAAAQPVKEHNDGTSEPDQPTTPTAVTDATAPPTAPATPAPASTLRTRSAQLRRRVLAAAGSSYSAIDPEHKLAALAKKSAADIHITALDLIAWGGILLFVLSLVGFAVLAPGK